MERPATYDDVNLVLRLYELRREPKMREARDWFIKSFKATTREEFEALCPQGSEQNAYFRMVVSYWDMAASFITNGVLHEEIFFESGNELLFVWERIRDMVPAWRELMNNPSIMKNIETVAKKYIEWGDARAPEWYGTFSKMVRGAAGD